MISLKEAKINLNDIDRLIYLFINKNKKIITKCLSPKSIKIKKLISILK